MKRSYLLTNALLAVLVAALAAICVLSVAHEQQQADKRQENTDARTQQQPE